MIRRHNGTIGREGIGILEGEGTHGLLADVAIAVDHHLELIYVVEMRLDACPGKRADHEERLRRLAELAGFTEIAVALAHAAGDLDVADAGFRAGDSKHDVASTA